MTTNSPASTLPACSIESVPNEILERIISFVPLDEPVEYRSANGDGRYLSQVIALMHTSRAFRFVTMKCKFWIDYEFNFAALVPDRGQHPLRAETRLNRLLYLLFSIPELARNLQRKTDWLIKTAPEILFGAMALFPIVETAQNVSLVDIWSTDLLLNLLSYCKRLISLEIRGTTDDLELGALVFFECLKCLTLELPRTFRGECDQIQGLEHLAVYPSGPDLQWFEFSNDHNIIPRGSTASLVSLDVTGYCDELFTLDEFDHLERLVYKLDPFGELARSFSNPVAQNSSRLSSLETEIITLAPSGAPESELALAKQVALFLCPCFDALKQLSLKILFWGEIRDPNPYIEQCMTIVEIIAKRLLTLEAVTLHAGLDVSKTTFLAEFKRLKSLTWNFPQGCLRGLKMSGGDATEMVQDAFKDFIEPPKVCVQLVRWNVQHAAVMPAPLRFLEFPS